MLRRVKGRWGLEVEGRGRGGRRCRLSSSRGRDGYVGVDKREMIVDGGWGRSGRGIECEGDGKDKDKD